jgi:hypothetical protein
MSNGNVLLFQLARSPMSSTATSLSLADYQLRLLFLDDFAGPVTLTTPPARGAWIGSW